MWSDACIVAASAVAMAAINMVGSVAMLWIRARYRWTNGVGLTAGRHPPHDPP